MNGEAKIDPRERTNIPQTAIDAALGGLRADIWTSLPGIVVSYNAEKQTAEIQPAIKAQQQDTEGKWTDVDLPVIPDVPVLWPGAGDYAVTFPLKVGDEGVLVFSARCIDSFWQSGGVQKQAEVRMHNLSDGQFIPTRISQAKKLANVSTDTAQFRNIDGSAYVELADGGVVNVKAPGGFNVIGNATATGEITRGKGTVDEVTLGQHRHPANNQPPTPGT